MPTYTISLDTARDQSFAADITTYVRHMTWANGMADSYDSVSSHARLQLTLDNTSGDFSPEKSGATYAALNKGMFLRVRADGVTLYLGKLTHVLPALGVYGEKAVVLTCDDPLLALTDGRVSYYPPLQLDVTLDEPLRRMFDDGLMALPYVQDFWLLGAAGSSELGATTILFDASNMLTFDIGKTELAFVGDLDTGGDPGAFIETLLDAEAGGRFFYDARTSEIVFHNRHRDILNDTLFATLSVDDFESADYHYGDDVANHVTVRFRPREVGAIRSVIWSAANVPIWLEGKGSRSIVARFRDPLQDAVFIGAQDVLLPTEGTDYLVTDSKGVERVGDVDISVQLLGSAAAINLYNSSPRARIVILLQLRGTPIVAYDQQQIEAVSGDSIRDHDFRRRVINVPAMSSADDAFTYADYTLTRFFYPIGRFVRLTFVANKSAVRLTRALTAMIGSRVRISDTSGQTGHEADYILVGEQHEVVAGSEPTHTVTWILKPAVREIFWILGVSGKSELGSTTILAF